MSQKNEEAEIMALLQELFGGVAVPVKTVEYSAEGNAFVMYNVNGQAFGGDFKEDSKYGLDWLIESAADGSLAKGFAMYEPVEPEILEAQLGRFSDWKQVYPVQN